MHLFIIHPEAQAVLPLLPTDCIAQLVGARLMKLWTVYRVAGAVCKCGGTDHAGDARQTEAYARKLAFGRGRVGSFVLPVVILCPKIVDQVRRYRAGQSHDALVAPVAVVDPRRGSSRALYGPKFALPSC